MSNLLIKQLGNGGAFNSEMTNSSFILYDGESYILFDCGFNVFTELQKQSKNKEIDLNLLDYVYISHLDDDHIGSLKTLIYYMYFMYNKKISILIKEDFKEVIEKYLEDIDGYVEDYKKVKEDLFSIIDIRENILLNKDTFLTPIKAEHFKTCYGLAIEKKNSKVFISGDTIPHNNMFNNEYILNINDYVWFHDFSELNKPDIQVHSCKNTFEKEYKNHKNINKYHNNDKFDNTWQNVDELKKYNEKEI